MLNISVLFNTETFRQRDARNKPGASSLGQGLFTWAQETNTQRASPQGSPPRRHSSLVRVQDVHMGSLGSEEAERGKKKKRVLYQAWIQVQALSTLNRPQKIHEDVVSTSNSKTCPANLVETPCGIPWVQREFWHLSASEMQPTSSGPSRACRDNGEG